MKRKRHAKKVIHVKECAKIKSQRKCITMSKIEPNAFGLNRKKLETKRKEKGILKNSEVS